MCLSRDTRRRQADSSERKGRPRRTARTGRRRGRGWRLHRLTVMRRQQHAIRRGRLIRLRCAPWPLTEPWPPQRGLAFRVQRYDTSVRSGAASRANTSMWCRKTDFDSHDSADNLENYSRTSTKKPFSYKKHLFSSFFLQITISSSIFATNDIKQNAYE